MKKTWHLSLLFSILILALISTQSCKKSINYNSGDLLGKWISVDFIDTLSFTTDKDSYKNINGLDEHYVYKTSNDTIQFQYAGIQMQYIYIGPSPKYIYHLNNDELTIDFRPEYMGFRPQSVSFKKRKV